jgi:hypothetical protein
VHVLDAVTQLSSISTIKTFVEAIPRYDRLGKAANLSMDLCVTLQQPFKLRRRREGANGALQSKSTPASLKWKRYEMDNKFYRNKRKA